MCGLFAVIPTIPVTEALATKLRMLYRLLANQNDSRGGHSWGMWSYDYTPAKGLGKITDDLKELCEYTDLWKPKKHGWIAGHTRYGTHGAKSVENSHPFQHENLTLAHNGVVTVDLDDKEVQAHVVDSGQLCIAISKFGMEKALGATTGMIGLLFNLESDNRLMAYRADQMLHFAVCPWGYAISSDKDHLKKALDFSGFFDAEIAPFTEYEVSAPWYEDFKPYTVKSGGVVSKKYASSGFGWGRDDYDWQSYRSQAHTPSLMNRDLGTQVYREGKWQSATETPLPYAREYKNAIKLVKGTSDVPEALEELEPYGVHGALHTHTTRAGVINIYTTQGNCDNCGGELDQDGGFYFDPELPDLPLSFCADCLEDMEIEGFKNYRTYSAT